MELWPVKPDNTKPYVCTPCGRSFWTVARYLAHQTGCPYFYGLPLQFTRNKEGGVAAPVPPEATESNED